jgi:hypothetical protein
MVIRFISSLTPEDEGRLAPAVLNAVGLLLDQLPLAYNLRIEAADGRVFQHAHTGDGPHRADADPATHLAHAAASLIRPRALS